MAKSQANDANGENCQSDDACGLLPTTRSLFRTLEDCHGVNQIAEQGICGEATSVQRNNRSLFIAMYTDFFAFLLCAAACRRRPLGKQ